MDAKTFLAQLAAYAAEFDFPVLDNANWRFASGRMRAFRAEGRFALTFELLIFQTQGVEFVVVVYGYGSLLGDEEGHVGALSAITELPDSPLWGNEGEWLWDVPKRLISVHGEALAVLEHAVPMAVADGSRETVVLSHGDSVDEAAFVRALARELGLDRMLPAARLFEVLPQLATVTEVLRLSNWDHPDVVGGGQPSDSIAITQAAMLLTDEIDAFTYDHSRDNVDWRLWVGQRTVDEIDAPPEYRLS